MAILKRNKKEDTATDAEAKEEKKPAAKKKAPAKKKAAAKPAKEKKAAKKTSVSKRALETILQPLVTEKSAHLADEGVMVLKVRRSANRIEIKQAFHELYGVTPLKVNIVNMRGKKKRFGRTMGVRQDWKKAMVKLPKGTRVDLFEGV